MLLTSNVAGPLRDFVVARLEHLTDAEPAILGDYTMALLKHDVGRGELARLVSTSLADFFKPGESAAAFTDALLGRLDELVAADAGSLNQGVKRPPDHRADVGPRLKQARMDRPLAPRPIPTSAASPSFPPPPAPSFTVPRGPFQREKKSELCRDYHCARGRSCHGPHTHSPRLLRSGRRVHLRPRADGRHADDPAASAADRVGGQARHDVGNREHPARLAFRRERAVLLQSIRRDRGCAGRRSA